MDSIGAGGRPSPAGAGHVALISQQRVFERPEALVRLIAFLVLLSWLTQAYLLAGREWNQLKPIRPDPALDEGEDLKLLSIAAMR